MSNLIKKKSLGQNFLKDESVLDTIIEAGELSDKDSVLEIGPGEGALTSKLLSKAKNVIAIEKDERIEDENSVLQKINKDNDNLTLLFGDILRVNLPQILQENNLNEKEGYKVIANIPYYITGKIIRLLFEQTVRPSLIVLLVQKEVADRICAKNGRQSILSLSVQYYATAEVIKYVPREAFDPAPKVDSAILKIKPFKKYNQEVDDEFFKIVKTGFSSPRKVLINNLKNGFKIDRSKLEGIFEKIGLDVDIRAERVTIEEWKNLVKELS